MPHYGHVLTNHFGCWVNTKLPYCKHIYYNPTSKVGGDSHVLVLFSNDVFIKVLSKTPMIQGSKAPNRIQLLLGSPCRLTQCFSVGSIDHQKKSPSGHFFKTYFKRETSLQVYSKNDCLWQNVYCLFHVHIWFHVFSNKKQNKPMFVQMAFVKRPSCLFMFWTSVGVWTSWMKVSGSMIRTAWRSEDDEKAMWRSDMI